MVQPATKAHGPLPQDSTRTCLGRPLLSQVNPESSYRYNQVIGVGCRAFEGREGRSHRVTLPSRFHDWVLRSRLQHQSRERLANPHDHRTIVFPRHGLYLAEPEEEPAEMGETAHHLSQSRRWRHSGLVYGASLV